MKAEVRAKYITKWDDGRTILESPCKVNLITHEILHIGRRKIICSPTQIVFWMIMLNTWMPNMSVLQTEHAATLSITSLHGLSRNNVVLHRFINPERIWKGKHYV